ncbi:MAG: hypothetical protein MUC96_13235 [Myxococcaceae bacterium]|jgi:hypothetical protein|nr:hypothetical protein [Myxococcaceae bacterium]
MRIANLPQVATTNPVTNAVDALVPGGTPKSPTAPTTPGSSFEQAAPKPLDLGGGNTASFEFGNASLKVTFRISISGGLMANGSSGGTLGTGANVGGSTSGSSSVGSSGQVTDGSSPPAKKQEVFLFGNKRRARKLGDYLRIAQKRGIPIDASKFSKEDLNRTVKKGETIAVTADGRIVASKRTEDIIADQRFGVSQHMKGQGKGRFSSIGHGGSIDVNGEQLKVNTTMLKSPVALDLNGDGRIGTTGVSTAQQRIDSQVGKTVSFDVDGDGKADRTEWMAGDGDALLVDDRDGGATKAMNGGRNIDGTRLFGDQGGKYANGYEKLAKLDQNGDGSLDEGELVGVKAWIDDGDGKLEAGELKTLKELGVTQVNTRMERVANERGESLMRSDFVRNGQRQMSEDVWFATKG